MEPIKTFIFFLAMLLFLPAYSQKTTLGLKEDSRNFYTDNLLNFYFITQKNQLLKTNKKGDSVAAYNDVKKYGRMESADVTNPLKILVYYPQFSSILILDSYLSEKGSIDLRKLNLISPKTFCLSYDNNIWVYDEGSGKIKKIADNGSLLFESVDLRLALNEAISPDKMFDKDGKLYLYDKERGFFIFDYYGTLVNQIPLTQWSFVNVDNGNIYGLVGNALNRYSIKTHIQNVLLNVNTNDLREMQLRNNMLILLYPKQLVLEPLHHL